MSLFLLYLAVAFFYIISPGPAVFLAISNGMTVGVRALIMSSLGNIVGLFLLSLVSILGLGAIVLASSTLFLIVKFIGAGYLLYLGVKQFRTAKALLSDGGANLDGGLSDAKTNVVKAKKQRGLFYYFFEGFLLAATNPKPILFFIAIFPQFLVEDAPLTAQFLIMTFSFMFLSFLSLFTYGYIGKTAKVFFMHETRMKYFHRITGGLFIGMGMTLLGLKNAQAQA
ncbi:MAG: LysE family translocator [Arenicella sp.]